MDALASQSPRRGLPREEAESLQPGERLEAERPSVESASLGRFLRESLPCAGSLWGCARIDEVSDGAVGEAAEETDASPRFAGSEWISCAPRERHEENAECEVAASLSGEELAAASPSCCSEFTFAVASPLFSAREETAPATQQPRFACWVEGASDSAFCKWTKSLCSASKGAKAGAPTEALLDCQVQTLGSLSPNTSGRAVASDASAALSVEDSASEEEPTEASEEREGASLTASGESSLRRVFDDECPGVSFETRETLRLFRPSQSRVESEQVHRKRCTSPPRAGPPKCTDTKRREAGIVETNEFSIRRPSPPASPLLPRFSLSTLQEAFAAHLFV